jgi:hypothetical protein
MTLPKGKTLHPISNCAGCDKLNKLVDDSRGAYFLSLIGLDIEFTFKVNSLAFIGANARDQFYAIHFLSNTKILKTEYLSKYPFTLLLETIEDYSTMGSFCDSLNLSPNEFSLLYADVKILINYRDMTRVDLTFADEDVTEDYCEKLLRESNVCQKELVIHRFTKL